MTRFDYEPAARALIEALQQSIDAQDVAWADRALYAVLSVSPAVAVLPTLLRDEDVWPQGQRQYFLARMHGDPNLGPISGLPGLSFGHFLSQVAAAAEKEQAPWITEWHLAYALLADSGTATAQQLGIQASVLLEKLQAASGRITLADDERRKAWCFVDTNLFLHYRFFDEVDWHRELRFDHVVLIVPPVVIRELDAQKVNPDPRRAKQRDRARKVLRRFSELAFAAPPEKPAPVRTGVDLLLLAHEPRAFPDGLDPFVADDRIVAAALEFRWRHVDSRVVVISGDLTLRVKAHARGLEQKEMPVELARRSERRGGNQDEQIRE